MIFIQMKPTKCITELILYKYCSCNVNFLDHYSAITLVETWVAHLTPTLQLSPAIRLIGDVDTVRVARTAQAKTCLVRGDLLVRRALSEVDFLFASLLPARGTYAPTSIGPSSRILIRTCDTALP